jgi:biotin transporter BioY
MTKRIEEQLNKFRYQNQPLRLNLCILVLIGLCSFLIVIATFTQFDFTHFIIPLDAFSYINADFKNPDVMAHFLKHYRYIPQIPAIMFIVALLGRRFGIISVSLYIIAGLFLAPVFALGGGLEYVFQYGFGYILAYIPAVFFAGSIIRSGLTYINMLQATFVGVITIHFIGVLYMLFISALQKENFSLILGWICAQSGSKIFYDLLFGFLAMVVARIAKKVLWVAMG